MTATADAMAHAVIHLDLDKNWTPHGTVDLKYDWTNAPHAEILGQRIDFTSQADAKLKPVIARLERDLPKELKKLGIRQKVQEGWASAFTVLSLNRENPPVWLRVKPTALHYGGYDVDGRTMRLRLGMEAVTESFVGNKPDAPEPTPLPSMTPMQNKAGRVAFVIPVVASYKELEPVLMKALTKRAAQPIDGARSSSGQWTRRVAQDHRHRARRCGADPPGHRGEHQLPGGSRARVWD